MLRWGLRNFSLLVSLIPKRVSYAISALVTWSLYIFWREGRESALDNLRHVLGPAASEAEVRRTALGAMRNFGKVLVEFLRLPWMREEEIAHIVQATHGEEHYRTIKAMRDAGRGVMVTTLHFGNWDVAALTIVARGLPVHAIVDDYGRPAIDAEARSFRVRQGIQVIPAGSMALRQIYRLLKDGGIVATAFDVPVSLNDGGVPVRFFDGTIVAPAGPARLALRTGAVVTTGFAIREPDDTFQVWINPPIDIQSTGDEAHDVRVITQAIARECEDFVRQYPDQWYIFRRMWVDNDSNPK